MYISRTSCILIVMAISMTSEARQRGDKGRQECQGDFKPRADGRAKRSISWPFISRVKRDEGDKDCPGGISCDSHDTCCEDPSTGTWGCCKQGQSCCQKNGAGYCQKFEGAPPKADCNPIGRPCKTGWDCCTGMCDKGTCINNDMTCLQPEDMCDTASDCCNYNCVKGYCKEWTKNQFGKFDLTPQDLNSLCKNVNPNSPPPRPDECVYMKWTPCPGSNQNKAKLCGWYTQTRCSSQQRRKGRGRRSIETPIVPKEGEAEVILSFVNDD